MMPREKRFAPLNGVPKSNMNRRAIDISAQRDFARLSGDYNPIHIDPNAARRSLFGRPVVHGVHALLWSLECWLGDKAPLVMRTLKADFLSPIGIGNDMLCTLLWRDGSSVALEVQVDGVKAIGIHVELGSDGIRGLECAAGLPPKEPCRVLTLEELQESSGSVGLFFDPELGARVKPIPSCRGRPPGFAGAASPV